MQWVNTKVGHLQHIYLSRLAPSNLWINGALTLKRTERKKYLLICHKMVIYQNHGYLDLKKKSVIITQNHYINKILDVYPLWAGILISNRFFVISICMLITVCYVKKALFGKIIWVHLSLTKPKIKLIELKEIIINVICFPTSINRGKIYWITLAIISSIG